MGLCITSASNPVFHTASCTQSARHTPRTTPPPAACGGAARGMGLDGRSRGAEKGRGRRSGAGCEALPSLAWSAPLPFPFCPLSGRCPGDVRPLSGRASDFFPCFRGRARFCKDHRRFTEASHVSRTRPGVTSWTTEGHGSSQPRRKGQTEREGKRERGREGDIALLLEILYEKA